MAKKQRYCVQRFADAMERQLVANDRKGGWVDEEEDFLWSKLLEEISEFRQVCAGKNTPQRERRILKEAADAANIIMMIADNFTWRGNPLSEEA